MRVGGGSVFSEVPVLRCKRVDKSSGEPPLGAVGHIGNVFDGCAVGINRVCLDGRRLVGKKSPSIRVTKVVCAYKA